MPDPGSSRGQSWTPEEDELLKFWQNTLGNKWAKVASHIPGRTGQQCAQRWRHKGNPEISKARWTAEEDKQLGQLVADHGNAWARIARQLPGRTDQQCMGRWRRHLDPGVNYGPWQRQEDQLLRSLVEQYGTCWAAMAPHFGNRTPQQCRSRQAPVLTDLGFLYMKLLEAEAEGTVFRKRHSKPTSTSPASKPHRKRRSVRIAVQEDAENVLEDSSGKQPGFTSQQAQQFYRAPEVARAGRGSTAEQRVPLAETRLLLNQERLEPASEVFVPRRPRGWTVAQTSLPAAQDLPPAVAHSGMLRSGMQLPFPATSSHAEDLLQRHHQTARRQTRSAVAAVATRVAPPSGDRAFPPQPPHSFIGFPDSRHVLYTFALPKTDQGPNHRLLSPAAAQQLLKGPAAAGFCSGAHLLAGSTMAAALGHRQAHPSLAKANAELEQADDTVLYTNALFLWLQLLLLRPLQPVLASHSPEMAARMRQLAWITAATYFLFCCPCLA